MNTCHIFSPKDILGASDELDVDFVERALVPMVDCMDNDVICYNISAKGYEVFNVVDEIGFSERDNLQDYFVQKNSRV